MSHNGQFFTVKLAQSNTGFSVKAYINDNQVSPSYTVDFGTQYAYFAQYEADLIENVFALAQSDIEQGMYFLG